MLDCLGWFSYDFADATIILVPEWNDTSPKRGRRGDALSEATHAMAVFRYIEEFCDAGMSRELAEVAWTRYEADCVDLEVSASFPDHRAFRLKPDIAQSSGSPDRMDDGENDCDIGGMVTANEVTTSGIRGKLREVQRVCEDGSAAIPTTIVELIELARENVKIIPKILTSFHRKRGKNDKFMKARVDESTMHGQLEAAGRQITAP